MTFSQSRKTKPIQTQYEPNQTQNKPNLLNAQMNVSSVLTKDYNNEQRTMNNERSCNTNPTCRGVASGEAGANPISLLPKSPRLPFPTLSCALHNFAFYILIFNFPSPHDGWPIKNQSRNFPRRACPERIYTEPRRSSRTGRNPFLTSIFLVRYRPGSALTDSIFFRSFPPKREISLRHSIFLVRYSIFLVRYSIFLCRHCEVRLWRTATSPTQN